MTVSDSMKNYFHRNLDLRYFLIYISPLWSDISTLNYGYSPVSEPVLADPLSKNQSYQLELYRQVFLALDVPLVPGQCICEVSCGRGGGLAYIARQTPARCIGLEKSWPARRYARKRFGLEVYKAVAPLLPLERESVDVFISVEAFHNYANDAFLREAARCLRSGGSIVIADRRRGRLEDNREWATSLLESSGFTIRTLRDIMPNVLDALRQDHDRKARLLHPVSRTFVHEELNEMFACVGSGRYKAFENGEWSYFLFRAVKR